MFENVRKIDNGLKYRKLKRTCIILHEKKEKHNNVFTFLRNVRHLRLTTDNKEVSATCVYVLPKNLDSDEKIQKEEEIIHLIQDTSFLIKIK